MKTRKKASDDSRVLDLLSLLLGAFFSCVSCQKGGGSSLASSQAIVFVAWAAVRKGFERKRRLGCSGE